MAKAKKEKQAEVTEKVEKAENAAVEKAEAIAEPVAAAAADTAVSAAAETAAPVEEYAKRGSGKGPNPNKKTRISYEKKKKLYGYIFIALWLVGTIYMFIIPLAESMRYSLSKTTMVDANTVANYPSMDRPGIMCEWNNFQNYIDIFNTDPEYVPNLLSSLSAMPGDTFMILVFSLFIALLLNQKFKGRGLARGIFFIPVLVATGPVLAVINGEVASQGVGEAAQFSALFQVDMVDAFLEFMGFSNISQSVADKLGEIASDLFNLIWRCGIQTIIFLSALQQIPTAAKEAAQMEGATGWEFFWKITFPTISPMILANLIYTVIDVFIDSTNPVMAEVLAKNSNWQYGLSTAMAWTYFGIVGIALGIISAIISKFVFYQVD
ncbi:MAG: sugar ABC transporter permease [Ruminococcaceae bacterium]|nr:sugar ABC transporter permease [Oscillospiraceae bacterium]